MLGPTSITDFPAKYAYNTSRLATQFVSCDGLPVPWNASCLAVKEKIFSNLFSSIKLDLTKNVYMLEENCRGMCFDYGKKFPLNEESAWFGPLSWILILLGAIITLALSIKKKDGIPLILLVSAYFFFAVTAMFKIGWDAYMGRYLILSTALIAPFIAVCLQEKKLWQKVITRLFLLFSILIAIFSVLANNARPIVTSPMFAEVEIWGKQNNLIVVTKVAYKIRPYFPNIRSFTDFTTDEIKESIDPSIGKYQSIINAKTVKDDRLAIVAKKQNFLDYYLFGDHFTRQIYEFSYDGNMEQIGQEIHELSVNTILVSNEIAKGDPPIGFFLLTKNRTWSIYQRK